MSKTGPLTYIVQVGTNMVWCKHVDQLLDATATQVNSSQNSAESAETSQGSDEYALMTPEASSTATDVTGTETVESLSSQSLPQNAEPQVKRYPERVHKPPDRLDL